jgi:hypothetical protein
VPQLVIATLTAGLIVAGRVSQRFREWLDSLPLRAIVSLHLSRFVGIAFLLLARSGKLPWSFAGPAGWGDIAVAVAALALIARGLERPGARRWLVIWNLAGALDILLVVTLAARAALADPSAMTALFRLPLSLVPTFLVPLIIASHLLLVRRLARTVRRRGLTEPAAGT